MNLPLARSGKSDLTMADASAVGKLFTIATTVEAADYFQKQFKDRVERMGLTDKFTKVLEEVDRFVSLVHDSSSNSSQFWSGREEDAARSNFMNFQKNLSEAAVAALVSSMAGQVINFDFDINKDAMLLQGSSIDGVSLDEPTTAQINNIFSDWLTQNGMICKDGIIYEYSDQMQDSELKRIDSKKYRDLFVGKVSGVKGFAEFVKEKTQSKIAVNVTDRSQDQMPEQAPQDQKTSGKQS